MATPSPANEDAILAWNTVLFDKFVRFRRAMTEGLGPHGRLALQRVGPAEGAQVVDLGCGFGDTTQQLARLVGERGSVLGIDAAERFVATATAEATALRLHNVRFAVGDVETSPLGSGLDYAFSRFGTMFFGNPVAALRNVRRSLRDGGRLCMVVWRQKHENAWASCAEQAVLEVLQAPAEHDQPTCGPGPFSMASADVTSNVLLAAGFRDIAFLRSDVPFQIGLDLQDAVEFSLALGPAGEIVRLAGDEGVRKLPEVRARVRETLEEYAGAAGVALASSAWIVTACAG